MGTVGIVQSVIKINSEPEEVFLLVQGVCRFILADNVSEYPFKVHNVEIINNFLELTGELIFVFNLNMFCKLLNIIL